tara:strand:- start:767 stop:952 length:186 start_codon:yes stop_codon:yes gene_type:complete
MQFHKKTSIGKSNFLIKILIKIALIFFLFIILLILVDQINFPTPNKKIEKIIPNENLKIVK